MRKILITFCLVFFLCLFSGFSKKVFAVCSVVSTGNNCNVPMCLNRSMVATTCASWATSNEMFLNKCEYVSDSPRMARIEGFKITCSNINEMIDYCRMSGNVNTMGIPAVWNGPWMRSCSVSFRKPILKPYPVKF